MTDVKEPQLPNEGEYSYSKDGKMMVFRSGKWYTTELDARMQKMQQLYPTTTPYTNGFYDKEKMLTLYNL